MIYNFNQYITEIKKSSISKIHSVINQVYKDQPEMIDIIIDGEQEAEKLGTLEVISTNNEDLFIAYTEDSEYLYLVDFIAKGGKLDLSTYRNLDSIKDIKSIVDFICDKITIKHKKVLTFPNELSQRFLHRIKKELNNRNYNYKEIYRKGFTGTDGKDYPEYELR